jgi:DNA-binding NarL/FixJ family response regulator
VDEIAVERALARDGISLADLTSAEQGVVIRELTRRGKSLTDIADALTTTTRTVSRRRAALRTAS